MKTVTVYCPKGCAQKIVDFGFRDLVILPSILKRELVKNRESTRYK